MRALQIDVEPACTPNPGGQQQFAEDWEHFMVGLQGGWMSGKTWIGARKLVSLHIYNGFDEEGEATFVPSVCVAPTYGNAADFDLPMLYESITESGLSYKFQGNGTLANGKFAAPAIVIPDMGTRGNPSAILIRTADMPKRITGFEVGAAWGDEPARWKEDKLDPVNDPYIQLLGRVRHTKARLLQIIWTYTNEGDATRIYDEMHNGKTDRKLYTASTLDNPRARAFYERQLGMLTKDLALQYLEGGAANFRGGRVYYQYDETVHVEPGLKLRPGLPIQVSFDFNIQPGMHVLIGQYHEDFDMVTCVAEIHRPRLSAQEAATELVSILAELDVLTMQSGGVQNKWDFDAMPLEIFGDATGGSEWSGTGQSNYDIVFEVLRRYKIPFRARVPRANPLVSDRVNCFNVALRDMAGEVHYKLHPRCERLKEDLHKMKRDKFGEIEKVDRKLSHASDAEGYRLYMIRPIRIMMPGIGGQFGV